MSIGVVLSVRTGEARDVVWAGRVVTTASEKLEREGPVRVTLRGLEGDEQGDLRAHGGLDKAICVYPSEHYVTWRNDHRRDLPIGAFGENLVTRGVLEKDVRVGDLLRIGDVLAQVVAPRRPCWKLGARWADRELPVQVQAQGLTGFYLRVGRSGFVRSGDEIRLVERDDAAVTVLELNRVMNIDGDDLDAAWHVLRTTALPPAWRRTLEQRVLRGRTEPGEAARRLYDE